MRDLTQHLTTRADDSHAAPVSGFHLLNGFIITDEIFSDGLTKHNFIKTLKRVFKAKLHCIWLIDKKFEKLDFSKNTPSDNTMFV